MESNKVGMRRLVAARTAQMGRSSITPQSHKGGTFPMTWMRSKAAVLTAGLIFLLVACGGGGGEADKSADQILADMAGAFSSVHSYHLKGTLVLAKGDLSNLGRLDFDLRVAGPGRLKGTIALGGATAEMIAVNGVAYLRGKEFFRKSGGDQLGQGERRYEREARTRTRVASSDARPVRRGARNRETIEGERPRSSRRSPLTASGTTTRCTFAT